MKHRYQKMAIFVQAATHLQTKTKTKHHFLIMLQSHGIYHRISNIISRISWSIISSNLIYQASIFDWKHPGHEAFSFPPTKIEALPSGALTFDPRGWVRVFGWCLLKRVGDRCLNGDHIFKGPHICLVMSKHLDDIIYIYTHIDNCLMFDMCLPYIVFLSFTCWEHFGPWLWIWWHQGFALIPSVDVVALRRETQRD